MIQFSPPYQVKSFQIQRLRGMSQQTIELHLKLYAAYVREANLLEQKISDCTQAWGADFMQSKVYQHLTQQLMFERNGMLLHEFYFENLKEDYEAPMQVGPLFSKKILCSFESQEKWEADFIKNAKGGGVGWMLCCEDAQDGQLFNIWIDLQNLEKLADLKPIVVMDMWEHVFLFDYQSCEREKYIKDFFSNIDWTVVEERLVSVDTAGSELKMPGKKLRDEMC